MRDHLRIALILETAGGGSGRHVLDLAAGLVDRGHDVTVIWSPTRAEDHFVQQLNEMSDVKRLQLPMDRSVKPSDYKSFKALAKLLMSQDVFDVLHSHSSKAGALVRLLPKSIKGKRIYTPHAFRTMDPRLRQPQRWIYGTVEKLLANRSDGLIAVSSAERDHAVSLGIDPSLISLVVNGIAPPQGASRETARTSMGLSSGDIAVGFVGRLEEQKDPVRFVEAVQIAALRSPRLRGIVIGDGALFAKAERANHTQSIHFMGWQDASMLFPGLDIFCMTSLYEAMPYTLIEALHSGVAIVTTDIGGATEVVISGENGHMLPSDSSVEIIADTLAELSQDAQKLSSFGNASRQLAKVRTIDVMVDQTLAVYANAPKMQPKS